MRFPLRHADGSLSGIIPGKCVCVTRNYAAHAAELGNAVPADPVFFHKPNTALTDLAGPLRLPADRGVVHHELELALVIGRRLSRADRIADDAVAGLVLALDLTLRELQTRLKAEGLPWEAAKAFSGSCPVGPLLPADVDPADARLEFRVNGELRQQGSTAQMIFGCERLLATAAAQFVLEPGDLLLTGTPPGVGPLQSGDRFEARVDGYAFTGSVA